MSALAETSANRPRSLHDRWRQQIRDHGVAVIWSQPGEPFPYLALGKDLRVVPTGFDGGGLQRYVLHDPQRVEVPPTEFIRDPQKRAQREAAMQEEGWNLVSGLSDRIVAYRAVQPPQPPPSE